jgi:hypothetical protein
LEKVIFFEKVYFLKISPLKKKVIFLKPFGKSVIFPKKSDPNGPPRAAPADAVAPPGAGDATDDEGGFVWERLTAEAPARHLALGLRPAMRDHFQGGRPLRWINELLAAKK